MDERSAQLTNNAGIVSPIPTNQIVSNAGIPKVDFSKLFPGGVPRPMNTGAGEVLAAQTQQPVSPYQDKAELNPQNPWQDFINRAKRVSSMEDFPVGVLLGQAALESARGKSAPGNNFFGLKGIGNNGQNLLHTQEYGNNGYYGTTSGFASFKTPEDSMRAYINLIKKNYPQAYAKRNDPYAMVQAIRAGGYATSPTYVQSVTSTPEFQQFIHNQ